jgi:L-threonylcarbamoyladenylate synthase
VTIQEAKEKLLKGDVVAIPTETVYGLAGWIYSEAGLKKIFSTKERPFFDPLIVHIDTIAKARALSSKWTKVHEVLAENCWPGPLTLIALKHSSVSPLITSGLDSIGLRIPRHPETLKLLSLLDGGLAAPSANKFGKTSKNYRRKKRPKCFGL